MEEYIRDAPQPLILPWTSNDDGCVTPKVIAIPDPKREGSHPSDECEEEATKADKRDKEAPPLLIPDLLKLSNATADSQVSTEATGWEPALATPPTCHSAPFILLYPLSKLSLSDFA